MVGNGREDEASFAEHLARTEAWSDRLADARCRGSGRFDRGLRATLAVFGPLMHAWNAEIIFTLRMHGALRFNQVKQRLDPISTRVLTDKLRHLEHHGFLVREPAAGQVTYHLTEHGEKTARLLHPVLFYLQHNRPVPDPRDAADPDGPGRTRPVNAPHAAVSGPGGGGT